MLLRDQNATLELQCRAMYSLSKDEIAVMTDVVWDVAGCRWRGVAILRLRSYAEDKMISAKSASRDYPSIHE